MNAIPPIDQASEAASNRSTAALYTTRHAGGDDVNIVIRLFVENLWHIAPLPPDADKVAREICYAIDQGRMLVLERDGEIVGAASYCVTAFWYSTENFMMDTGFLIASKYRKTRAAYVLLQAFKREAREKGLRLFMGAGTKDQTVAPIMAKRYPQITIGFLVDLDV